MTQFGVETLLPQMDTTAQAELRIKKEVLSDDYHYNSEVSDLPDIKCCIKEEDVSMSTALSERMFNTSQDLDDNTSRTQESSLNNIITHRTRTSDVNIVSNTSSVFDSNTCCGNNLGRKRKYPDQNRHIRKMRCQLNKRYVSQRGKVIEPREFCDVQCKSGCHKKVSSEQRHEEFDSFWKLPTHELKMTFVASRVTEVPVKRKRVKKDVSRRSFSKHYTLAGEQVCKKCFTQTLSISGARVHNYVKKFQKVEDSDNEVVDYNVNSEQDDIVPSVKSELQTSEDNFEGREDDDDDVCEQDCLVGDNYAPEVTVQCEPWEPTPPLQTYNNLLPSDVVSDDSQVSDFEQLCDNSKDQAKMYINKKREMNTRCQLNTTSVGSVHVLQVPQLSNYTVDKKIDESILPAVFKSEIPDAECEKDELDHHIEQDSEQSDSPSLTISSDILEPSVNITTNCGDTLIPSNIGIGFVSDSDSVQFCENRTGRKRKYPGQNREIRSIRCQLNKTYINQKGKVVIPKEFRDFQCKSGCHKKVSIEKRREEFEHFWQLPSYELKAQFITSRVTEAPIKRRRTKNEYSKRSFSRQYTLAGVQVCKQCFTQTLRISGVRVHKCVKKFQKLRVEEDIKLQVPQLSNYAVDKKIDESILPAVFKSEIPDAECEKDELDHHIEQDSEQSDSPSLTISSDILEPSVNITTNCGDTLIPSNTGIGFVSDSDSVQFCENRTGRKRKYPGQNREIRSIRCQLNKTYINQKGKVVIPKEFRDFQCKSGCHKKVSIEKRREEFEHFWQLPSYELKAQFITSRVTEAPIKRRRTKNECSRRSFSRQYTLAGVQVCKKCFTQTLRISGVRVHDYIKKNKRFEPFKDNRGRSGGSNRLPDAKVEEIVNHISRFVMYRPDYSTEGASARCLPTYVSLPFMYKLFKAEYSDAPSLAMYRKIFYTKF